MRMLDAHRLGEVGSDPEAPPMEVRMELVPGDLAMLLDEISEDDVQPFWVEVDQILGPGAYLGVTERGSAVEFCADHVADIEYGRGPAMGMAWYDAFKPSAPKQKTPPAGVFRHFAPGPRRAPPAAPPPGTPPPSRKSIFDVFRRRGAPGATPVEEKGGFFDFFRRKPKTEVGPIPPSERREVREQHSFRLPPATLPEGGRVVIPSAGELEIPEVPESRASLAPIPGQLPDDMFSILVPEAERPSAPSASAAPTGAVIIASEKNLPAQTDVFSILSLAEPKSGPVSMAPNPFDLLTTEKKESFGPPGMALDPFQMLAPEAPSAFDILVDEAQAPPGGMVVREAPGQLSTDSIFDILKPEPGAVTAYQAPPPPPTMETLYDALKKGDEPEQKVKPRAKKKSKGPWKMPSQSEWVDWIKGTFNLKKLWDYIRDERKSEYFVKAQEEEEFSDSPPILPVETWADMDWESTFDYFGIPVEVWQPYIDKIHHDEETDGYADEAWEEFNIELLYPLSNALDEAFKSIQPDDITGSFVLNDDPDTGTWGLLYYEPLTKARKKDLERAKQKFEQEQKELERQRKSELKRIWGPMPKPEDLVPWIEERFDLDTMFSDIKKTRRTKEWKQDLRETNEAMMVLEVITDIGPKRPRDYDYETAAYFGIPPDVITLYQEADSEQELWNEVFWPFFDSLREAFSMLLPYADLPGQIVVEEDEEDHLAIQYQENEE